MFIKKNAKHNIIKCSKIQMKIIGDLS